MYVLPSETKKTVIEISGSIMSFDWFGKYRGTYENLGLIIPANSFQNNVPPTGYLPTEGYFTMKQLIDVTGNLLKVKFMKVL